MNQGIMIWGCFSANGIEKIVPLSGRVNPKIYLKLLEQIIREEKRVIGNDFIQQHDNTPIHKAKIVMNYKKNNNINVLGWPPTKSRFVADREYVGYS